MSAPFKDYLFMPEQGRWFSVNASSPEDAYNRESNWYSSDRRIAILDPDTMEVSIFTKVLDKAGNLVETVRHDKSFLFD